jgi:hypothetical protein
VKHVTDVISFDHTAPQGGEDRPKNVGVSRWTMPFGSDQKRESH